MSNIIVNNIKTKHPIKVLSVNKKNKTDVRAAYEHELFQWLALHEGTFYNDKARLLRDRSHLLKAEGEGHSEKAIRQSLGFKYDAKSMPGSASSFDIEEILSEIKDVVKFNKKSQTYSLQSLKFNKCSRDAWTECRVIIEKLDAFNGLDKGQLKRIQDGNFTLKMLNTFPLEVQTVIKKYTNPSYVMRKYSYIFLGGFECFLKIKPSDYSLAFEFNAVSMGGCIKYKVRRHYFVSKIIKILKNEQFQQKSISSSSDDNLFIIGSWTSENSTKFHPHEISMRLEDGLKIPLSHMCRAMRASLSRLRQQYPDD